MLDYIVIGGGPSGLIVNGELEKSGLKGLCLESGEFIRTQTKDIYSGYQILNGYKNKKYLDEEFSTKPILVSIPAS